MAPTYSAPVDGKPGRTLSQSKQLIGKIFLVVVAVVAILVGILFATGTISLTHVEEEESE